MIRVQSRSRTLVSLVALVSGLLVVGLMLPFVFGKPVSSRGGTNVASGGFGDGKSPFSAAPTQGGATTETTEAAGTAGAVGTQAAGGTAATAPVTGASAAPTASAGSGTQTAPAPQTLTASDVGVTPTTIKVG